MKTHNSRTEENKPLTKFFRVSVWIRGKSLMQKSTIQKVWGLKNKDSRTLIKDS